MQTGHRTEQNGSRAVTVVELTKRFGSRAVVNGLSMDIERGEIVALLGPNGAGKTTFMRMLTGLLLPDSGHLSILGAEGGALRKTRSSAIGYCPQRLIVWKDLSCEEQLLFVSDMYRIPRKEGRRHAHRLLEMFNLADRRRDRAAYLSGGMQRRLSIALAMVHNPDILILDEPEAGLDPRSRVLVRNRLQSLCSDEGRTILVSTHDMEEADRMATRVAILDGGRRLAMGTPDELKRDRGTTSLIELAFSAGESNTLDDARRALEVLGLPMSRTDERLILDADDEGTLMRPVRTVLGRAGIIPSEIRLRRRSLEDVFIALTGRGLAP